MGPLADKILAYAILSCAVVMWNLSPAYAASQAAAPISIEADQAILKEKNGYSLYRGNVVLIQGDMKFSADEVKLESKKGKLDIMTATGNPVSFQQQLPDQKSISAKAQSIQYFSVKQMILLTENATLTQGNNQFTGNRIEYNVTTDTVTAGSKVGNPERVKIIIRSDDSGL
jgi:lipopolysaccharide export system protein LptA